MESNEIMEIEIEPINIKPEPLDPEEYEEESGLQIELNLEPEVKVELEEEPGEYQPLSYDDNVRFFVQPNVTLQDLKKECLASPDIDEGTESSSSNEENSDDDFEKTLTKSQKNELNIKTPKKSKKSKVFEYPPEVEAKLEQVRLTEEERAIDFEMALGDCKSKTEFVCELCAMGFTSGLSLASHQRMHTQQYGENECDICHWHLKSVESLKTHRQNHYVRYQCKECWLNFTKKDVALYHVAETHVGLALTCPYPSCDREFKSPIDLQEHWERHRSMHKYYKCQSCSSTFRNQTLLNNHHKNIHKTRTMTLPCPHCEIVFNSAKDLIRHRNTEHDWAAQDTDMFSCELCDRTYTSRRRLNQHINRMHTGRVKRLECDHCHNKFYCKPELRDHIQWTHMSGHDAWACPCGRVFRSRNRLLAHAQTAHTNKPAEKTHPCGVCGKLFESNYLLNRHIKRHSNDVTYPCPACDMKFKDRNYVQVHYKLKHLNMTREEINAAKHKRTPMTIEQCSKIQRVITVEEVQALAGVDGVIEIKPEETSMKPKEFPCEQCGKIFKTNALLRRHQKVHTDTTYPCPACPMRFKDERYVGVHYQIKHLNMSRAEIEKGKNNGKEREKRFECKDCNKLFLTNSLLRRHEKIHTDVMHPCPRCDAKFKDPNYVKRHYKLKHVDLNWEEEIASKSDGKVEKSDEKVEKSDGKVKKSDGKVKKRDGKVKKRDGKVKKSDGKVEKVGSSDGKDCVKQEIVDVDEIESDCEIIDEMFSDDNEIVSPIDEIETDPIGICQDNIDSDEISKSGDSSEEIKKSKSKIKDKDKQKKKTKKSKKCKKDEVVQVPLFDTFLSLVYRPN